MDKRNKAEIFRKIKGGLIVSCQALPSEPLYGSDMMARMAYAAMLGGAVGIRANTPSDIRRIKEAVDLPVIGLYKQESEDSSVYITPTVGAVEELAETGAEIIAMDATDRIRPGGVRLSDFFREIRRLFPDQIFMADCATYEDVMRAQELGFDLAGTTLRGYTEETKDIAIPDMALLTRLSGESKIPVIAEGGIWTASQLKAVMKSGVYAAVIGTAITRPRDITRHFVDAIS